MQAGVGEVEESGEFVKEVVEFGEARAEVQVQVDSAEVSGEGALEVGRAGAGGGHCWFGWLVVFYVGVGCGDVGRCATGLVVSALKRLVIFAFPVVLPVCLFACLLALF